MTAGTCPNCGQVHTRCAAHNKQTGGPCNRHPAKGGTVCKPHGGGAPQVIAANQRRLMAQAARDDLSRLGIAIETTPVEALEAMLCEAAGNVVVLRSLVDTLDLTADRVAGQLKWESAEAKPHIFVVMYNEERDRLARLAKDCAALGLDERKVRVAEASIDRLFTAVSKAVEVLPADVRGLFRERLAAELRRAA